MSRDANMLRPFPWRREPALSAPPGGTTFIATPGAVSAARQLVAEQARDAGAHDATVADIKLAVTEGCTNAVVHAFTSPGGRGAHFTVTTACADDTFTVWIADQGRGVPDHRPSQGLALGLALIGRLCARVQLGVIADGRTQIRLSFDLGAPARHARNGILKPCATGPAERTRETGDAR